MSSARHRQTPKTHLRPALIGIVGVALVAGVSAGAWMMSRDDNKGRTEASAQVVATSPAGISTASPSPTPSTSQPPPSTPAVAVSGPPQALLACRDEVAAGEALARAATSSYQHWSGHIGAQVAFDRGEISLATTQARWASSKAPGLSDVSNFAKAEAAREAKTGACGRMGPVPPAYQQSAADCRARSSAQAALAVVGAKVNAEWAAHITMMAQRQHTDGVAYSARWRQMVAAAPTNLNAFEKASGVLNAAPACSVKS